MTFPEARAALAALSIVRNRQLSTDMRERLIRLDALAILDALEAAIRPSYCPRCGKPVTACCEMEEIGE